MDTLFNLAFVADRLNMSQVSLFIVPIATAFLLWIASRMTATRNTGLIFYKGGSAWTEMARFSFAATMTLAAVIFMLRAEPQLQVAASRALVDISALVQSSFAQ